MDINSLGAFCIALVIGLVVAFGLAKPLRTHPVPFYLVAFALVGVYCWAVRSHVNLNNYRVLTFVLQKGYLSSVLLAIVMFIGCLDNTSPVKKRLRPVRGELSVLSFIFILGHLAVFMPSYLERLLGGAPLKPNVEAAVIVALALTALFTVLGVTSFKFVHRAMSPRAWKNLQRLAYLRVALYIVHVGFFLGTSVLGGSGKAHGSLVVYCVVVGAYAALRVGKALRDRRVGERSGAVEAAG